MTWNVLQSQNIAFSAVAPRDFDRWSPFFGNWKMEMEKWKLKNKYKKTEKQKSVFEHQRRISNK